MTVALRRNLVTGALLGMLAAANPANPATLSPALAAPPSATTVRVAARILPMIRVQLLRQPATLEITAGDVERGFVELRSATVLRILTNTPWRVSVLSHGEFVRSTRVSDLSGRLQAGPDGHSRVGRSVAKTPAWLELSYRFELSPDARPGTYPWPVTISANAA